MIPAQKYITVVSLINRHDSSKYYIAWKQKKRKLCQR